MYEKIILPSGLKIFLVPFEQVLSVSILVFVGAGSRYETKEQNGLSHFLEHMFFKGTEKRPVPRLISETIDKVGGELNAGTAKNYTVYTTKVAARHLDRGLELLADILQHSLFDPQEIEKEKGVIAEEIRMYYDIPQRYVTELYDELIWGDTPLGRDIAGTVETIQTFKRHHFLNYTNSFYSLDNIIIGIGGKFDKKTILSRVQQYFKKFPSRKKTSALRNTKKQTTPQYLIHQRDTEQSHLCLGFRTFSHHHPDKYALLILETILGGNMSSRLFTTIREKMGLAYMITSSVTQYFDVGTLMIQAGLKLSETEQAIKTILQEVKKIKEKKVPLAELNKAKEYLKGKLALSLDDPEGVTDWICRQELLLGKVKSIEEIIANIEKVTADDLLRIARKIFIGQGLNLALIGPFAKQENFIKLLSLF